MCLCLRGSPGRKVRLFVGSWGKYSVCRVCICVAWSRERYCVYVLVNGKPASVCLEDCGRNVEAE